MAAARVISDMRLGCGPLARLAARPSWELGVNAATSSVAGAALRAVRAAATRLHEDLRVGGHLVEGHGHIAHRRVGERVFGVGAPAFAGEAVTGLLGVIGGFVFWALGLEFAGRDGIGESMWRSFLIAIGKGGIAVRILSSKDVFHVFAEVA